MKYVGDVKREYQRKWYAARRTKWIESNGPCVDCGTWNNLEVDHADRSKKEFNIVWSWSWSRLYLELKKCVARCEQCHKKKTTKELTKIKHGTRTCYMKHRCRCNLCIEAAKSYRNEQRYKTGKRKRPEILSAVLAQW